MGDSNLMGPVRVADARAYQASYLHTTPAPPPIVSPDLREQVEHHRTHAAMAAARRNYPPAVADALIDALAFHASTKHRVAHTSLPARLIDELLRPVPS